MDQSMVGSFFSHMPMVICTSSSTVVQANPSASAKLKRIAEGEKMFDYMDPYDILRFEAAFTEGEERIVLNFPIAGYHGFHYAASVHTRLMGRKFAGVYLFHSKKNFDDCRQAVFADRGIDTNAKTTEFIKLIADIPEELFPNGGQTMFDLRAGLRMAVSDAARKCDFIDCELEFADDSEDDECIPTGVNMDQFLRMILLMLGAMNNITSSRHIDIKLCRYGEDSEVRITTKTEAIDSVVSNADGLVEAVPGISMMVSACDWLAGCSRCAFSVNVSDDCNNVTLALMMPSRYSEDVDFKSCDQFSKYNTCFRCAVGRVSCLRAR